MNTILDTMDELGKGRNFVHAAYMAAHGANGLVSEEMNALASILDAAETALSNVEAALEKMKDEKRESK